MDPDESSPFATQLVTDEFILVRYDDGFSYDVGVFEVRSGRTPESLIHDVIQQARSWGRTTISWHDLSDSTKPAGLHAALLEHGAVEDGDHTLRMTIDG